jgi:sterol desaturase/sphingolipid hydroxylase (fatty acid hydroxylase superfamily)
LRVAAPEPAAEASTRSLAPLAVTFNRWRAGPSRRSMTRGALVSASQIQVRAATTEGRLPLIASRQGQATVDGRAGVVPAGWRRLCLSSVLVAGLTAFILWVAVDQLAREGRLETVLSAGRAELAAPLLVALVVAAAVCERIWPAERRPLLARGHVQDACFVALHAIVVIPLMTLLSVGAAALIGHARWIELRSTEHWPAWLLMPLTVVAMDGANWLAHYADHRLGPLWRFHALHHSQEELSVLTSFRAHPLMHTTGFLLATVPVVALMPGRPIAPVLITVYVCIGTLQHANLRWTFGPAGRVLVSPAYHRLHHAPDTQQFNLGVVLTIWDVLAGRARFPSRSEAVGRTGLDGRPVPVEQDASAGPGLLLLAEQLIEPFQARQ